VYTIPAALVKDRRVTLAVRILDVAEGGVFGGDGTPYLYPVSRPGEKLALSTWKCQATTAYKDLPPAPIDTAGDPNQPTALFNGMIAPLTPFAVRGVLWYQGESNTADPVQYRTLFPELIRDWRLNFRANHPGDELPFLFVQLANYMARTEEPVQSGWAETREAQAMALTLPRTAMATAIDIGEGGDIHPRNKEDVGKRLALAALAIAYTQEIEYSGPVFTAMETEGGRVRLRFNHAQGLSTSDGKPPRSFAVRAKDGPWRHAHAEIHGDTILLSHRDVPLFEAVRYAWANNPDVNLVNGAGLPAVPFRTDAP
jgi:sialate O-acetylesterase